ncbi:DUF559 domain-containing protein [Kineococcus arenarius]|uniref:DUF559 domain-containing protein n=1 Tax=Kineococcus sp. SYSU DK007 TaxID=3383128 RepID=UPI003D7DAB24
MSASQERSPRQQRTWPGVVVYRRLVPSDGHRTDVLRTVLDCLQCLPLADGVTVADAALHRGLVLPTDLAAARDALHPSDPRRKHLLLVDPLAMSPLESLVRVHLVTAGLRVRSQVHLPGVGRVDLLVDGWLAVELDGHAYHSREGAYREDRRRDRAALRQGVVVLRFTYEDVVRRGSRIAEDVQRVLRLGPPWLRPRHRRTRTLQRDAPITTCGDA